MRMRGALVLAAVVAAVLPVAVAPEASAALQCGGRPVTRVGTAGDDSITGTNGPDVIHGLGATTSSMG